MPVLPSSTRGQQSFIQAPVPSSSSGLCQAPGWGAARDVETWCFVRAVARSSELKEPTRKPLWHSWKEIKSAAKYCLGTEFDGGVRPAQLIHGPVPALTVAPTQLHVAARSASWEACTVLDDLMGTAELACGRLWMRTFSSGLPCVWCGLETMTSLSVSTGEGTCVCKGGCVMPPRIVLQGSHFSAIFSVCCWAFCWCTQPSDPARPQYPETHTEE